MSDLVELPHIHVRELCPLCNAWGQILAGPDDTPAKCPCCLGAGVVERWRALADILAAGNVLAILNELAGRIDGFASRYEPMFIELDARLQALAARVNRLERP